MQVLISEKFKKNVPQERKNIVKSKLQKFTQELKEKKYNIKNISNGFSVWKVRGTDNIYKFRVDRSNRVLFTFTSKMKWLNDEYEDEENLFILDYCNHDEQIHRSRNIDIDVGYIDIESTDYSAKEKEIFYDDIDIKYKNYYYDYTSDIISIYNENELEKIFGLNNKDVVYKLNENQIDILNAKTPLFLFGSAGSGKTTVGVRKIRSLYDLYDVNIGYFTYSELLKKETEKTFDYIGEKSHKYSNSSTIDFYDMTQYLEDISDKKGLIKYKGFKKWLYGKHILNHVKADIDPFEVYREIRGIIKGMIGVDWGKSNSDLYNKKLLDKVDYINLSKETSTFEDKDLAYDIALRYQSWLDENDFVDDNDLTISAIRKIGNKDIKKYDFLVVDEIQDLTEKQIYLLYKLVKDHRNLIFSGDFNQTINATYFDTHRIKTLFKLHSEDINLNEKVLTMNYRSDKEIVKLANRVSELRAEKLYKNKNDYEEKYIDLGIEESCKPIFLNSSDFNKENLLSIANDRHYVAIIVSDESEKSKLKSELGVENNVFTVSEIKGIEVHYVVCYNIVSNYKKQWKDILNKIDYKSHHLYRYYFNIFYVAITRARKYICFYEEESCDIYNELKEFIIYIDEFNEDKLNLNTISTDDDYFKTGKEYEVKGAYEQAINQYKQSKIDGIKIHIKRCEALILKEEGEYLKAADKLFDIHEYNLALECYKACKSNEEIIKCMLFMNSSYDDILDECKKLKINILDMIFNENNNNILLERFYKIYNDYLGYRLIEQSYKVDELEDSIESIRTVNF